MSLFSSSKLQYHSSTVHRWCQKKTIAPILLEIDPTLACDHSCPDCTYPNHNSKTLTQEQLLSLIQDAHNIGIPAIQFTGGGEPLLHPHLAEAYRLACSLDIHLGLITNGQTLDRYNLDEMVTNFDWIRISLDAGTPETYKRKHGNNADFNRTVSNLHALAKAKRYTYAKCRIGAAYLMSIHDTNDVYHAMDLTRDLDYLQIRPYRGSRFDPRSILDASDHVMYSEHRYDHMHIPRSYTQCHAPDFVWAVGADYKLYPCCDTKYTPHAIRDLSDKTRYSFSTYPGTIYPECPQPCRHDANNQYLSSICTHFAQDVDFI